jgi:hypothetical protein
VPRTTCICAITKRVRSGRRAAAQSLGSRARADGTVTGRGDGKPRPNIVAASIKPSTRLPNRSSTLPYGGGLAFWSSETPEASPSGTWAESTTSGCGSGDARTWWEPYAIRPRRRESSSGLWTSAAPRPRVQPAGGEFPSHRGAAFCVPTAGFKGTAIWWVPPTSPPGSVAERRARRYQRSLSTVGPARCRHGVIGVATSMIAGGVDPAWPRAIRTSKAIRLDVARRARACSLSDEDEVTRRNRSVA